MGVDKNGISIAPISLEKIARIIARISPVQKLRQKSQLNNSEISLGDRTTTASLIPNLPMSRMIKAEPKAIKIRAQIIVIKYIADITLSSLVKTQF